MDTSRTAGKWPTSLTPRAIFPAYRRAELQFFVVVAAAVNRRVAMVSYRNADRVASNKCQARTARVQTEELAHFKSLGATGVISKPFDPMTLAASVRSYMQPADAG